MTTLLDLYTSAKIGEKTIFESSPHFRVVRFIQPKINKIVAGIDVNDEVEDAIIDRIKENENKPFEKGPLTITIPLKNIISISEDDLTPNRVTYLLDKLRNEVEEAFPTDSEVALIAPIDIVGVAFTRAFVNKVHVIDGLRYEQAILTQTPSGTDLLIEFTVS